MQVLGTQPDYVVEKIWLVKAFVYAACEIGIAPVEAQACTSD